MGADVSAEFNAEFGIKSVTEFGTEFGTEIAIQIGHPKSARAVANACGQNPYPPIVPCHRVVRRDGGLGGYSGEGGIETKRRLLIDEVVDLP